MTARKSYDGTRLTALIEKRILELRPTKTQAEIAAEAGFYAPVVRKRQLVCAHSVELPIRYRPAPLTQLDCALPSEGAGRVVAF